MANCAIALFLASCFVGLSSPLAGAADRRQEIKPEWRMDLRPAIRNSPVPTIITRQEAVGKPESSLWFTTDNTVVATFVVHRQEEKPEVAQRGSLDRALPLRLRVIVLNADTGKVDSTRDLPTDSRKARILAVHDGKVVILGANQLTLYSPDLLPAKSLTLPAGGADKWSSRTSPSGKDILLNTALFGRGVWVWVETDSLKILASWEDSPSGFLTISDESLATSTCWWGNECRSWIESPNGGEACREIGAPKCESKIQVRGLWSDWKTIALGEKYQFTQFVNNDVLFVPGKNTAKFIKPDGTLLLEEPKVRRSWGTWNTGVVPSAEGQRFVIPSCQWKGGIASLDVSSHQVLEKIFVYDVGSQIKTQAFDVRGPRIKNDMEFALSPHGTKLAILNDEFVEIFQLPSRP
jgi:hypothetical protein